MKLDCLIQTGTITITNIVRGKMLHGQVLHGHVVLGHFTTVKDDFTNFKWSLRYFPREWMGGWVGRETLNLMLTQSSLAGAWQKHSCDR